ncbi:trehalose-phosphatase [bacterium]|nr:trehalose-phosphatase [bacterium]
MLFLFLDYDGTLREIAGRPQDALPDADLLRLLRRLERSRNLRPVIITGRSIRDIRRMLPLRRTCFIGTHGLEFARGTGTVRYLLPVAKAKSAVNRICAELKKWIDGSFTLENKTVSLSLHDRLAPPARAARARRKLMELVRPYVKRGILDLIRGKCVLEVRPMGAHKGIGVEFVLDRAPGGAAAVAFGDDRTDEDMFRVLNRRKQVTVVVGKRKSAALFRVPSPRLARKILSSLHCALGTDRDVLSPTLQSQKFPGRKFLHRALGAD